LLTANRKRKLLKRQNQAARNAARRARAGFCARHIALVAGLGVLGLGGLGVGVYFWTRPKKDEDAKKGGNN
jgi:hypothetical protein